MKQAYTIRCLCCKKQLCQTKFRNLTVLLQFAAQLISNKQVLYRELLLLGTVVFQYKLGVKVQTRRRARDGIAPRKFRRKKS